jgi:hypothetical protein
MASDRDSAAFRHADLRAKARKHAEHIEGWQQRHAQGNPEIPAVLRALATENFRLRDALVAAASWLRVEGHGEPAARIEAALDYVDDDTQGAALAALGGGTDAG